MHGEYAAAVNAQQPDRFERYRDLGNAGTVNKLTLGVGAGVLAASLPLWLPEEPDVPAWAWAVGGIGVVAAGIGAKLAIDADSCLQDELGRCTNAALAVTAQRS